MPTITSHRGPKDAGVPYSYGGGLEPGSYGQRHHAFGVHTNLKASLPGTGVTTLWAWDNPQSAWYFYAPSLETQGGTALSDYIAGKGYLDFVTTNKKLGNGTGFWVNR